jgi:hypothetical protein
LFTPVLQPSGSKAFAVTAIGDKLPLERCNLLIKQVIRLVDQAN